MEKPPQPIIVRDKRRWLMLGLTWSLYSSFGISVGTIPPVVGPIINDLHISYTQMGLILGSWQLVYIATASPLGPLVDRLGIRRSLGIGMFIILLSMLLRGLAIDFYTLLFAVALFGIGGPIISIGAPKIVSLWFDSKERGTAAGIYTAGPVGGYALALATAATTIMPITGTWRGVPLIFSVLIFLVMIAWFIFAKEKPYNPNLEPTQKSSTSISTSKVLMDMLRIRNVQLMLILAPVTFMINHGMSSWLPTLLQERNMSLSEAGTWTAIATAASILSLLVIPRIIGAGYRAISIGLLLLMTAISTPLLIFTTGNILIIALLVSTIVRSPFMPMLTLILMETPGIGYRHIGAATGIFFAAAEIGGFGGPFVMGLLRDITNSLNLGVLLITSLTIITLFVIPLFKEESRKLNLNSVKS